MQTINLILRDRENGKTFVQLKMKALILLHLTSGKFSLFLQQPISFLLFSKGNTS